MDHDLLMMIYGAVIGVGSSIVTTLFQSWLGSRERERQRKKDKQRDLQQIYIPTLTETKAVINGDYVNEDPTSSRDSSHSTVPTIVLLFLVIFVCGGLLYLIFWIDNPVLYLMSSGLIAFLVTFVVIKLRQAS